MHVDMELLRLIGEARIVARKGAEGGDIAPLLPLLDGMADRAEGTLSEVATAIRRLSEFIQESEGIPADEVDRVLVACEGVVFHTSPESLAELEGALTPLGGKGGVASPTPTSPLPNPDEGKRGITLHTLAARVVQMDPTDLTALAELGDEMALWLAENPGDGVAAERLAILLEEARRVASNSRSRKAARSSVVERIGEALEEALLAEEEEIGLAGEEGEHRFSEPVVTAEASGPSAPEQVAEAPIPDPPAEAQVQARDEGEGGEPIPPGIPSVITAETGLVLDFVAEGEDYLNQAEEALLALELDPEDAESVNVVFRAFHTIKGVSAFLELDGVARVAHEAETLLAQVREGSLPFTASAADLFLRSGDVLRTLLEGIREVVSGGVAEAPAAFEDLLEELCDPALPDRLRADRGGAGGRANSRSSADSEGASTGSGVVTFREEATSVTVGGGEDSVRIRTERLDVLVDLVGELVVAHSMIAQDPEILGTRGDLGKKIGHYQKILRELQDLSTSLRMIPLKPAFQKVSRVIRDVSRKVGKPVQFLSSGDETELDRSMVGIITDPLVHMVRNSVDHGIEPEEERVAAGKPPRGTVRLTARQAGGNVVVEIEDDGRGLDRDRILAKAVERGIVDGERHLSDDEVFSLILQPGFSTAAKVTDVSGRGVGMDVVKRAVESLRGRIEIQSEPGKGTRFSIYLPLTLAITDGMLIRVGDQRYIVPTVKIQLSFRPTTDDVWTVADRGETVMLHGSLLPVMRLHRLFDLRGCEEDLTQGILVVVGEGARRTAILVDELLGQQQFVVKALSESVSGTPGVAGGAILADGGVGLILDPEELVSLSRQGTGGGEEGGWEGSEAA